MKGTLRILNKKPPVRYWLTESGIKVFNNFKTITYLQQRMYDEGILDEIY